MFKTQNRFLVIFQRGWAKGQLTAPLPAASLLANKKERQEEKTWRISHYRGLLRW
jgi:hypothetical protein